MVCCSIVGCKSKVGSPNIKFHRIPKARLRLWGKIINRINFKPTVDSRVCSRHFVSGYPGWDKSDPDWIPSLNIPKSQKSLSEKQIQSGLFRSARQTNRSKLQEEVYESVMNQRFEKKQLILSVKFHDYAKNNISMEEIAKSITETSVPIAALNISSIRMENMDSSSATETSDLSVIESPDLSSVAGSLTSSTGGIINSPLSLLTNKHSSCNHNHQGTQTDYYDLEVENHMLRNKIKLLEERMVQKTWGAHKIKDNDEMTKFYTGLPTFAVFMWLFNVLEPKAERMRFWRGKKKEGKVPKPKRIFKLTLLDQFFAVLMRLKVGLFTQDIAERFDVSPSTFSDIFNTWIKLMELELCDMFPFPTRSLVDKFMPQSFKKYHNTRIIIDCTEIFVERSTSLDVQNQTFSSYKHHNTMKFLVGITPGGVISFVSEGWGGRVSDKVISQDSKFILLLDDGDNVMADKGFLIADLLKPKNCTLNLPPFLKDQAQFSEKEIIDTRRIAEVRIHVERAIARIKKFHVFDGTMPISMARITSSMFAVCAYLTNIYEPLI